MSEAEKNIIASYASLFEGLTSATKQELIESLSQSLKADKIDKDRAFYNSYGAFVSNQSAEELIRDIKSSRRFREKDINL